jgi:hypothetical protein
MANRVCPLCGAEYFPWVHQCTSCRVALDSDVTEPILDPRDAPEDERVVYDFAAWPPDAQADAAAALADAGVPHYWEGVDLVVHQSAESLADTILDRVEAEHGLGAGGGGEVEYDLEGWSDTQRSALAAALDEAGVDARFEGDLLVVDASHETVVDSVFDAFGSAPDTVAVDPDAQQRSYEHANALFLAAERLRRQPDDDQATAGVLRALEEIDTGAVPYGFEVGTWQRLVAMADDLADALVPDEGEPDDDVIVERADALHRLLRPLI